jgi:hypothetical protein
MARLPVLDPKATVAPISIGPVDVNKTDLVSQVQERAFAQQSAQADRVAAFLNKAAVPGAKAKGAAIGALTAPTVAQIEAARLAGKPITAADLPGDPGSISIVEQAARAGALAVIEDRFEMVGRRALTDITLQAAADPNMTPGTFGLMLDQAVQDHTQALLAISPSSAAKIQSSLALAANSQVLTFSRNFATRELKARKDASLQNVNTIVSSMKDIIFAHDGEPNIDGSETPTLDQKLSVQLERLRNTLQLGGHNETKIKSTLTRAAKEISKAKVAVFSEYAASPEFSEDPTAAIRQLQQNKLPPRLKAIFKSMNPEERVEGRKALLDQANALANTQQIEDNATKKENKVIADRATSNFSKGFSSNNVEAMKTARDLMETVDPDKAADMTKEITAGAVVVADSQADIESLDTLRSRRNLTHSAIAGSKLTPKTKGDYYRLLESQTNSLMTSAEDEARAHFQPDLQTPPSQLSPRQAIARNKYIRLQKELIKERRKAEDAGTDFDPTDIVTSSIAKVDAAENASKRGGLNRQVANAQRLLTTDQKEAGLDGLKDALNEKSDSWLGGLKHSELDRGIIRKGIRAMEALEAMQQ